MPEGRIYFFEDFAILSSKNSTWQDNKTYHPEKAAPQYWQNENSSAIFFATEFTKGNIGQLLLADIGKHGV